MNNKLKEVLLPMLYNIIEEGIDLETTPVLFKWRYDEEPYVQFQLLIKEEETLELPDSDETLH